MKVMDRQSGQLLATILFWIGTSHQQTGLTGHKITLDSLASVEMYVQQKLSISVLAWC